MGPTASGKTALAEALALEHDAQLINADAFQVYRGLDVGTAKPTERHRYELLDLKDPDEGYGVGEFIQRALPVLERLFATERSAIVVGGTGLYIRALFEEYQDLGQAPDPNIRGRLDAMSPAERREELIRRAPHVAQRIDLLNPVRVQRALERLDSPDVAAAWRLPDFRKVKFATTADIADLDLRIGERVESMMHNGWVREVESLLEAGYALGAPGFRAIGYRALIHHLHDEVTLEEAMATTIAETRSYAKRQRTWLRSEPNCIELSFRQPLDEARRHLFELTE
jgi:tRNA dimethylallyltransferase